MKNRILYLLLTLILTSTISGKQIIKLSDYGIQNATDATPVILDVLNNLKADTAILIFPKGIYHFYTDNAFGKYHAITNHDNSYKYFAFPLINKKNIEIDGQQSEFIFHGLITPFLVERSSNISIRNLTIDWEQPLYMQARVIASNPDDSSIKLKVDPKVPALLSGTNIGFSTNGIDYLNLGQNIAFDPKTRAVAYNAQSMQINEKLPIFATQTAKDEYLVKARFIKSVTDTGLVFIFKGPNRLNRMAPAIHLKASKNVKLENIIIHHAGGMGIIGEKTENISINNIRVQLREGTDRLVTTTADATHFSNCKGKLIIENCLFENMLDDATNIHGTYVKISKIIDKYTLIAGLNHFQQSDFQFAEAGDKINFVKGETLLPLAPATIKSVRYINSSLSEFTFEDPLPADLSKGDALDNITWYPEAIFRNNTIRNNRARGVLISSRNKTIIENNHFSSMMSAILFEGDLNFWYESGSCNDVIIRNNYFGDNVYGNSWGSVIFINPRMQTAVPNNPYEKNIQITNNVFKTFDNPILIARSVENLVFENNAITQTKTYTPFNPTKPTIELIDCLNARITANSYTGDKKATLSIDANSTTGLQLDKSQKGFESEFQTKTQKKASTDKQAKSVKK